MVAVEHMEHFLRDAEQRGITVLLAGLQPAFGKILQNVKFQTWLPSDRLFPEEDEKYSATLHAVRHAYHLLGVKAGEDQSQVPVAEKDPKYYLV